MIEEFVEFVVLSKVINRKCYDGFEDHNNVIMFFERAFASNEYSEAKFGVVGATRSGLVTTFVKERSAFPCLRRIITNSCGSQLPEKLLKDFQVSRN